MDCWQCGVSKELKEFITNGVLHYENCNSCYFEDLFGADTDTEINSKQSTSKKSQPQIKPKAQSKANPKAKLKKETASDLTRLQKIRREFLSFNQKTKLEL